jgi:16S rRNA U516 pseudouridylate synthase RsuA-like enzyme
MCERLGYGIVSLRRTRIGTLRLGPLAEGKIRKLTRSEIDELKSSGLGGR